MQVYFAASTNKLQQSKQNYLAIINALKEMGHIVLDSWAVALLNGTHTEGKTEQDLVLQNIELMQEADFLLVEISQPSFGVGYCVGQAIAHKKKVLCLYPKDIDKGELSDIVTGSSTALLSHKSYTSGNIKQIIEDFITSMNLDNLRKFNFIINEEISNYIDEGALREGKSKSEFLRDKVLKDLMGR